MGRVSKKNGELRPVVEDHARIDIIDLKKDGILEPGTDCTMTYEKKGNVIASVIISAKIDSLSLGYFFKQKKRTQEIVLLWSPCHYGAQRTWLKCPLCASKRNALYLGPDGIWACRVCHGLVYQVQRLNPHTRHQYRAQEIKRKKLQALPGEMFGIPEKPFGMSNKKHNRIVEQIVRHEKLSFELFMTWVEQLRIRADKFI